ncbi:MAG: transcription initiation factor IIB [Candidatus Methanomethylicia archaeon]|jgi:transcription initiation factor TFIIB|uniref:Transcription initiation factor IIB n=1 Tax=Thermoproteota archaeon TaxID=2056631 RepID=A0A520KE21_9CREN|nr:transcription initiation factor IIB [Candidatus Methanomethylicia archaeon]NHV45815.1 transcription initiation factor IIB [Candidatus Verstraetearchaeota archaeon]RZN55259.1 MAG: transcription initiation factor IIB [Candidatus Verstraetearchaeota archaeon]TDA38884.1 MAG: transcription initiation factor IIB [Candidatus Verstraetearchaeota archaeon]
MSKIKTQGSYDEALKCPNCGSTSFVNNYERGEVVCTNCGLVVTEKVIDRGPEWRAFTSEERDKRSRVGSPLSPTVHDKGLSTVIDWRDKDAMGRKLEPKKRIEILRWRKWQIRTRVHSSIDRNLAQAMSELDRISSQLELPKSVKEEAAVIYRKAVEKGLVRGRSIESVMAAAIYAACRTQKVPRTLDEIAKYTKAGRKDVARCYRLLLKEVNIKIPIADPIDFTVRIGSILNLSGITQHRAAEIIREAKKRGITAGKDPAGLAAAAIYIASLLENERRTQKEIAQAAQVTEVTVRNRYKELMRELKIEIPLQ